MNIFILFLAFLSGGGYFYFMLNMGMNVWMFVGAMVSTTVWFISTLYLVLVLGEK